MPFFYMKELPIASFIVTTVDILYCMLHNTTFQCLKKGVGSPGLNKSAVHYDLGFFSATFSQFIHQPWPLNYDVDAMDGQLHFGSVLDLMIHKPSCIVTVASASWNM